MRRTGHSSYSITRDKRGAPEVADSGGPPAMGRWSQSATAVHCSFVLYNTCNSFSRDSQDVSTATGNDWRHRVVYPVDVLPRSTC